MEILCFPFIAFRHVLWFPPKLQKQACLDRLRRFSDSVFLHCWHFFRWLLFVFPIILFHFSPEHQRKNCTHTLDSLSLFFSSVFKKQENILFSSRNNKYTIFLYEQNAQFTKSWPSAPHPTEQHCPAVCIQLIYNRVIVVISML